MTWARLWGAVATALLLLLAPGRLRLTRLLSAPAIFTRASCTRSLLSSISCRSWRSGCWLANSKASRVHGQRLCARQPCLLVRH